MRFGKHQEYRTVILSKNEPQTQFFAYDNEF